MNALNNVKVGTKLIGGFLIVALIVVVVAVLGFVNMNNINTGQEIIYTKDVIGIANLGHTGTDLYYIRGDVYKHIILPAERPAIETEINGLIIEITNHMAIYRALSLTQAEKDTLAGFDAAWVTYQKETANNIALDNAGKETTVIANLSSGGSTSDVRKDISSHLDTLSATLESLADNRDIANQKLLSQATTIMIIAGVVGLLLALGLGIILSRSITGPLSQGVEMMQAMSLGSIDGRLKMERKDEIGILAGAMDRMADSTKLKDEELRGASLYTRNLIEASLDPLVTISSDGKITDVNKTTEQVTGVVRERLIGSDFADYFTEPEKARAGYQQVFSQGMVKDYPLSIRHSSGRTTDVLYNASVYKDEAGMVQGVFAAARDITERKLKDEELVTYREQLEEMVKQRTAMLTSVLTEVKESVGTLTASASEILATTTQVASGTAESASSINETTTTVEEVRQAAQLSSQKAQLVSDSAQRVAQVSNSGQKAVEETSAGMDRIREQMETIAQTVIRLSEQSQSIGGIIAAVTDLAGQSNLLAVNAAIEAAKAGEQGKGFAVVAQEIKSLAEQSKQATAQVRGILSDVQKATSNAVMATEQGSKAVEAGVKQAAQAGEAIRILAETSDEAVQTAIQIVSSSKQQVVGMDQIGIAMENINQAGSQNAASMKQMEVAAQNLHELGEKLKELVAQFKV